MNLTETGMLLTFISELDYRRFTEETATAWHDVLGKYDYQDCREAVRIHNETSGDFLKPGHIGKIIQTNRRRRLNSIMDVRVSDVDDMRGMTPSREDHRAYQDTVKAIREAVANGTLSRDQYQAYWHGNTPWSQFQKTLGAREPMKAIAA
ncbi:hypothetical protein [Brevibacterium antiquum]|uniref:Uncharacterized protein n=1 Tax=Brevibacterium antiquum TaxID=234835 RepID=A0A2H1IN68_9MICO|nr:hypothetical protein [Brevibacterium antiquum]SMX76606.1 hypothetical protein BANT10_01111 [Brevibacterium antiquum]